MSRKKRRFFQIVPDKHENKYNKKFKKNTVCKNFDKIIIAKDLLYLLLSYMDVVDFCKLSMTCKEIYNWFIDNKVIWKLYITRDKPDSSITVNHSNNCKYVIKSNELKSFLLRDNVYLKKFYTNNFIESITKCDSCKSLMSIQKYKKNYNQCFICKNNICNTCTSVNVKCEDKNCSCKKNEYIVCCDCSNKLICPCKYKNCCCKLISYDLSLCYQCNKYHCEKHELMSCSSCMNDKNNL